MANRRPIRLAAERVRTLSLSLPVGRISVQSGLRTLPLLSNHAIGSLQSAKTRTTWSP